jgi:hypothetical protein
MVNLILLGHTEYVNKPITLELNDNNRVHLNKNGKIIARMFHSKAVGGEWK